jgi:hypothetical protein
VLFGWSFNATATGINLELGIDLQGFPNEEVVKDKKIEFKKVCNRFGSYLARNRGLWGSGPFSKITCITSNAKQVKTPWQLSISGDNSIKMFEIFYLDKTGKKSLQASYSIKTEVGPLSLMAGENGEKIAFYLASSLPFRSVLPSNAKAGANQPAIKGPAGFLKDMTPPQTLEVFSIKRYGDFWRVNPRGRLSLKDDNGKLVEWVVAELDEASLDDDQLFVAQIENSSEILERVDQLIRNSANTFFEKFLNFGRSAYVGGRYGVPLKGQGVMKSAPLIGIFGEFRSGLLSGLRLNYDFIPKQKDKNDTGSTSFDWSRFQLGYSFSKNFSGRIINSVDITPRLGVGSLNYEFVPSATSDAAAFAFKTSRAPTIGLEFGVEKSTNYFRLRGWTFGSYSVGILPLDKNHTTTSLRLGLDVYREVLSFNTIKLALLGFTAAESTKIQKKLTDEQQASDSTLVSQLQLNSMFLGGGVTLTW